MTEEPVAVHREQAGFSGACVLQHFARAIRHGLNVASIDFPAGKAGSPCPRRKVRAGGCPVDPGSHAVVIVYANKQDGKRPKRRKVHRFVEHALLHGAVAEERHRDPSHSLGPVGQCRPDRVRYAPTHDGVCPQMSKCNIRNVHGSALPGAIARLPAADLRKHPVGPAAARQEDPMTAVMCGETVVLGHFGTNAGNPLLADGKVKHRAGCSLANEHLTDPFLEGADPAHRAVEINQTAGGVHFGASRTGFSAE